MNYGIRFMTLYRRQGSRPSPWKRNAKKAKWLSGEALQIAVKRREAKSKGEKDRYKHVNVAAAAAAKSLQSCPTLSDPMDCSLPCSSAHGIFQARVLEWGAIAFSKST